MIYELDENGEAIDDGAGLVRQYKACKAMWASVMWQALCDAVRLARAKRNDRIVLSQQALEWFAADDEHVGSFIWVCGVVNIDPQRTREKVNAMVSKAKRRTVKLPRFLVQLA